MHIDARHRRLTGRDRRSEPEGFFVANLTAHLPAVRTYQQLFAEQSDLCGMASDTPYRLFLARGGVGLNGHAKNILRILYVIQVGTQADGLQ